MRLDKLTPDQEALLPVIRDEWLAVGLSTERADRARAEAGVRAAYAAAKLPPPAIVVWLESPLQGVVGAEYLRLLLDRMAMGTGDQVRDQVWDQVGGQVEGQVRDQVGRAIWGQHEAGWLAYYAAIARFGLSDLTHPLDGITEVARSAGWWWSFRDAVLLTERPLRVQRDERNRLHAEDGPAIVYPDGWGVWSWHGVRVPREIIETPADQVTAEGIAGESNVEVRRVLVERIGAERYLALAKAKLVNRDDWGALWAIAAPVPMRIVELINSTPEPDGHSKRYFLRVPETRERRDADACVGCGASLAAVPGTAHQAVAWSYSSCTACYVPVVQT